MNARLAALAALPLAAALGIAAICGSGNQRRSANPETAGSPAGEWVDAFAGSTFSARYTFSGGEQGFQGNGEVALFKRGTDRIRIDMHFTLTGEGASEAGDAATTDISVIQTPGGNVLCIKQPGIFGIFGLAKEKQCLSPDDLGDASFDEDPLASFAPDKVSRDDYDETTIAGHKARCYDAPTDATPGANATPAPDESAPELRATLTIGGATDQQLASQLCFSREGWLLRIGGSDITTGADSVSDAEGLTGDVDDAVFDLPYPMFKAESLSIRNNSDVTVFVQAHASGDLSGIISDSVEIKPHDSGTLKAGVSADPEKVAFGTYESPQWQWTCAWDDAKSHEPLVIGDDTSNCPDAQRVPGWSYYPADPRQE